MKTHYHRVWGSAAGSVRSIAPQVRIICGLGVFLTCLIAPYQKISGLAVCIASTAAWLAVVMPPWRVVGPSAILGLILFVPYLILIPFMKPEAAGVPAGVFLRGMCGVLISATTVSSLSLGELHDGVSRLPLPSMVTAILLQIIQQTGTIVYETERIASAMAVRGATGSGYAALKVLSTVPQVWLPRVVLKAERLADAMDMRGYNGPSGKIHCNSDLNVADIAALAITLTAVETSLAVRLWWQG